MIKKHCLLLLVITSAIYTSLLGQNQSHNVLKELYPDQPVVVLNKKDEIVVSYKNDKLGISIKVTEEMMYMDNTARAYNEGSVYHGTFTSIKKIKAYSQIPKEDKPGKFRKKKVKNFVSSNVNSSGIFYDDQKQLGFQYTGLVKGSKTFLTYEETVSDPKFLGRNFFSYTMPTLHSAVSITVPENVKIGYELISVDTTLIKYSVVKKGKKTTHSWIGKKLRGSKIFGNGVDISHYAPHVIIYFKSVQHKDSLETILPNTQALYNWYHSIVKDVNAEKSEALKSITDSLLTDVIETEERAKKIYYWVQDNIKYVAFEDGMGGFVPRNASLVCQRRFGDCKDMSSILVEMLGYGGIDGHLTWIGTRDLPYKYSEIHTPAVDNHMIASYRNNGKTVFLDAVGSYTPYGFTTAMIQGKEALIGIDEKKFRIEEVPIVSKEKNVKTDVIQLELKNGQLEGKGNVVALGYAKLEFVYDLINLNDTKKKEKLVSLLHKGNNKFLVNEAIFDGLSNRDKDFKLQYNFTLGNYVSKYKDELYINLHLDKNLRAEDIDKEKRGGVAVKFNHAVLDTFRVSFTIPKGYALHHLPANESFDGKDFGFTVSYKKSDEEVTLETIYYNSLLVMDESKFEDWNEMIFKLSAAYQENLVFKKQ
jgi:hypothetical protein